MTRDEQPQPTAEAAAAKTPPTSAQVPPDVSSAAPRQTAPALPLDPALAGSPGERARALLRVRAYRRLWTTQLIGGTADRLALLVLLVLTLQASAAERLFGGGYRGLALTLALGFSVRLLATLLLGALLLAPLYTLLTERLDRRWTLVGCDVLRAALIGVAPWWVVWAPGSTAIWLLATVFAVGAAERVWTVAKGATAPTLLPVANPYAPAVEAAPSGVHLESLRIADLRTGWASVPLAAAALVLLGLLDNVIAIGADWLRAHQTTTAAIGAAVLFVVSAVLLHLQHLPGGRAAVAPPRSPLQGLRAPADATGPVMSRGRTGSAPFFTFSVAAACASMAGVASVALLHAYDRGAGPVGYGLLVLAATGAPALGMRTSRAVLPALSRRRLLALALGVLGISLILAGLVPDFVLALLLTTLAGTAAGIAIDTGRALLDQETEEGRRPKVTEHLYAVMRTVIAGALIAVPLVAAAIGAQRHGSGAPGTFTFRHGGAGLALAACGLLTVVLAVVVMLRTDDRRGSVPFGRDLWSALRGSPPRALHRAGTGYFIALEGGDGSGKSTQAQALAEWIRGKGHEVVVTREPGGSPVGQRLRSMLLDVGNTGISDRAEALMYAADRAEHVENVVRPALERGAVVITDRYMDSSIAYQGAGRDLSAAEVARISRWATGGLVPDLTVLLDVAPEAAQERFTEALDRLESEPDEFHQRVRTGFLALAAADPVRYLVVDAGQPAGQVTTVIRHRLDRELPLSEKEKAQRIEQERLAKAEAERRAAEEARLKAEAEEAERKRQELLDKLRAETEERERLRKAEEERQAAEAARRLAEEEAARRAAEETRRLAEEETRRRAEEEERRRVEAEAARQAELQRQREVQRAEQRRRAEEALQRAEEARLRAETAATPPGAGADLATGAFPDVGAFPDENTTELPQVDPVTDPDSTTTEIPERDRQAAVDIADSAPDSGSSATSTLRIPRSDAATPVQDSPWRSAEGASPAEETAVLPKVSAGPPAAHTVPGTAPEDRVPNWMWRPEPQREAAEEPVERTREMPVVDPESAPAEEYSGSRPRPEWAEETPMDDLPSLADRLLGSREEWERWEQHGEDPDADGEGKGRRKR